MFYFSHFFISLPFFSNIISMPKSILQFRFACSIQIWLRSRDHEAIFRKVQKSVAVTLALAICYLCRCSCFCCLPVYPSACFVWNRSQLSVRPPECPPISSVGPLLVRLSACRSVSSLEPKMNKFFPNWQSRLISSWSQEASDFSSLLLLLLMLLLMLMLHLVLSLDAEPPSTSGPVENHTALMRGGLISSMGFSGLPGICALESSLGSELFRFRSHIPPRKCCFPSEWAFPTGVFRTPISHLIKRKFLAIGSSNFHSAREVTKKTQTRRSERAKCISWK